MSFKITDERIETYTKSLLARHDEGVLLEMESEAEANNFPIVGRMVGVTLEILARGIGAKRVFELGSGYGYSAYWFARAVEAEGHVWLTDGDAVNAKRAENYLSRAGLWGRCTFIVGDAVTSFGSVDGDFDVVYCDIDKHGHPDAWRAARERVRVGGLYICDNTLWSGRVTEEKVSDDVHPGWTEAIREHNTMIADDKRY